MSYSKLQFLHSLLQSHLSRTTSTRSVTWLLALGLVATFPAATSAKEPQRDGFSIQALDVANPDWQPRKIRYSKYLPAELDQTQPVPLIINLHGGGGSEEDLKGFIDTIGEVTASGAIPPAVWSMPGAGRSFYMDYQDRSAHWESIIIKEYLPHLLETHNIDTDRIYLMGISMGGMGGLRLAFKYPEKFAGVAVLEPAIEASLRWEDISPIDSFYRADQYEEKFGAPVNADYWEANHPSAIAAANPDRLKGLAIYFECGDQDFLNLHRGAEYLHRILFDSGVLHEFRLVRGANHLGDKFQDLRYRDALGFINRDIHPIDDKLDQNILRLVEQTKELAAKMGPAVPLPPHR